MGLGSGLGLGLGLGLGEGVHVRVRLRLLGTHLCVAVVRPAGEGKARLAAVRRERLLPEGAQPGVRGREERAYRPRAVLGRRMG